ncbi:ABC transporter permease [Marmoricola sp. URHB0036]|uniref:ABC transporter permease n=1 Tax=Marmoricola sp. URHB0036 TaxID=1298863 RepID=UPI00055DA581|nr:ABC transporter permease [Marmoricola sp. URHB0036]
MGLRDVVRQSQVRLLLGLVVVWVVMSALSPNFLTTSNVLNILLNASPLMILAVGVTVTLIAAEIDLSIAALEAFTGAAFAVLAVKVGLPWPAAAAIALLGAAGIGLMNGLFVTRVKMPSFVTTLAMLSILQGFAFVITKGTAVYGFPNSFSALGQGTIAGINTPIILAVVVVVIVFALLRSTRFGLEVYAVGGNADSARLAGVNVERVKQKVFMLSSITAGIAGLVLAARIGAGSGSVGQTDLLDAIAAVAIGGTSLFGGLGTLSGTVIGVLFIASIRNGLVLLNVSAFWAQVAIGAVILLAVFLDHLTKGRLR